MVTIVAGDGITLVTDEDRSVSGSATAVGDPGDILSYGVTINPVNGSVAGDAATGVFTYTPIADFFGNDSFDVTVIDGHGGSDTLRVEVTVAPVNDAPRPTSATPATATGNEEAAITGTVAMTDPEGNRMTFRVLDAAKNGRVNIDQNGKYTYTGNKDFFGADTFTVKVTDIFGASTEVPVTVTVANVQDAPVFRVGATTTLSVTTGITSNRTLIAIDPDGEAVTYRIGSAHPQHGDLGLDPVRGTISYTPEEDYLGPDQFTLEARDASGNSTILTVNLTVKPLPQLISISNQFFDHGTLFFYHRVLQYEGYQVDEYLGAGPGGDFGPGGLDVSLPFNDFAIIELPTLTANDDSNVLSQGYGHDFPPGGDPVPRPPLTGAGTTTYSSAIFGVGGSETATITYTAASNPPPPVSFEEFMDGLGYQDYPAETFEASYQAYVNDNNNGGIWSDQNGTKSSTGTFSFDVARGGVLTDDPVLAQFLLDQYNRYYFREGVVAPEVTTAGTAPRTAQPESSYSFSGLDVATAGIIRFEYITITDNNLPLVVVTPVGGSFSDTDGDGDFDFSGEVEISFRRSDKTLLRLTGADVQMDASVLHVTGATVYAAVSEGAGLHDALFKGSFDIDRFTGEVLSFSAEAPPEGGNNPYYAPGGLALTYSGFKLDFDRVEAFAKMAMPVPLFEGVNLDLADMTGLLDNGGFTFAADHYGFSGGSVSFGGIEGDFFGLFEMEAEELTLTYDNTKNEFSIDGEIAIKSPVLELIPGAKEPELTFSDMKLKDGKFSFDGELAIEELKLPGGFGLSDVALALTLTDNVVTAFSGETHVSLGEGKLEPIFGIGFKRPPLSFDKITLGADNLNVHLGDGVFLEKIQGTLENLADVPTETEPGLPTQFTGTLGFGWGPEIEEFTLPEFLGGIEVGGARIANLEVTGTMDFEGTFNETITLNFLSDDLIKMTGVATLDLGHNSFSSLLAYDVLGGIATGQMETVANGHGITAHGTQALNIPALPGWGPISGIAGLSADAFLSISTDAPSQSFYAVWTTLTLPIGNIQVTAGFKLNPDGFSLITGGNDLPKTNSFDVNGTEDWLLITASWENPIQGHVLTQVRMPGNIFIQEADYAAYGITLVPDLTNPNKTAIVIDHPDAGNYDLQVTQPGVGTVKYHGISPNPAETFAFDDIVSSPGDIDVSLGGLLAGAPAGSTVAFFYDTDGSGADGHLIGSGTVNAAGEVSMAWHLPGTHAGDYHVYAVAFDGMNAPTTTYADDIVRVALAPTDITVNDRASALGSPDLSIREDVRPGSVIAKLGLADPDFGHATAFTLLDNAGGRFKISGDKLVLTDRAFLDVDGTVGSGNAPALTASALGLPDYVITVQATDSEGFTITRDIQIDVTDLLGDDGFVVGTEGGDYLYDDNFGIYVGRGGDDNIDGGGGVDIAIFGGFRRNYSIEVSSGGGVAGLGAADTPSVSNRDLRPGSPDGFDHLTGIEVYRFFDGDFTFADLANSPNVSLEVTEFDPLPENSPAGTLVATVSIANAVPDETFTFLLVDDAGGVFQLSGDQILLAGALDFETTAQYVLKVQASDTTGAVYEQNIIVDVSDVDENVPSTGPATGTPIIIGNAIQGQTLTVDATSVNDPDGILFGGFLWERSTDGGVTFIGVTTFSNDPTYVVVGADVGALLRVTVAIQDVLGNLSAVFSDPTAPVTTTNHAPTGAPVIIGTSLVGETLTADTSGIADDDGLSLFPSFTWVRIRAGVSEGVVGSGETYVVTDADAGARLKLVVDYSDGAGFSEHLESSLSARVVSLPGETLPRIEFASGGGTVQENLAGRFIGTLLFDGIDNPALIYTIASDPSGAFELDGHVLKLKDGVALDFEAAALRSLVISVSDGVNVVHAEPVAVTVSNQPAGLGNATHEAIPDATVFNDVLGLIGFAGPDGLNPRQWVNESNEDGPFWDVGPIAVEFAPTRFSFRDFQGEFRQGFDDDQKDAARDIFALVSNFTGVDFVEASRSAQPHIKMAIGSLSQGILGVANGVGSDEILVGSVVTGGDPTLLGSTFHLTLMHELGHTLGLDHGSNSGFADELPHVPLAHDRIAYSVMLQNNLDGTPQSYMMIDIAALQYLYGADFTTNSGDTVYSWSATTGETFVNGVSTGATAANHILTTVWDGGGNDTYDASNYDGGVEIDLRPGEFSTLSIAQLGSAAALGNVGNAYLYYGDTRSLIENAIGGDGADTFMGNAGDNRLKGNGGADDVDGGGGTDTAVFTGAHASYAVTRLGNGDIQVTDLRIGAPDGTDVIRHVELFAFLDNTYSEATLFTGLPPVVTGPVALASIAEDSPARLITQAELLATASDPDSPSPTAINLAIATGKGALIDNQDGTWSYTPAADDDTAVSFSYVVTDGLNAVAASATLDITSVSDAPPITPGTLGDDSFTATTGAERFEAGTGNDTITFDFRLVDATFTWSGNQVTVETLSSHTELTGFEQFVFTDGMVDNSDGSPLIDDLFYYARYHDVWNAGVDADLHYNVVGWLEGRDPSAFFSTGFYRAVNQDVKVAGINPLTHFDQVGWQQGRQPSMDFDAARYLGANPDVAAAQMDPLWHFLGIGASEGRQPFALDRLLTADGFDYVHYLKNNPDVAAAGVDPLQHFQVIGWKEGRDPNALFDTSGYLSTYTDVAAAGINPFDHYNIVGWTEGRDPSTGFDTTDYLAANPDVAAAKVNPLIHFLHFGINEGRSPQADGLWG